MVRNPLRVENHVGRMAAALVPGVIATTTQARYYGLHPLVATVAQEEGLELDALWERIRRTEVALGWISMHHEPHRTELPEAHGQTEIRNYVSGDSLDLARASMPGNYVATQSGFAGGAYFGSELELGLLERSWTPGPRFDHRALTSIRERLSPLLELAHNDVLDTSSVVGVAEGLCVCAARQGNEGEWLRDLIWGRLGGTRWAGPDASRRGTALLLARSIEASEAPVSDPIAAMRDALCFGGPLEASPVAQFDVAQAGAWRGLFLRHYLVTAWRELWAEVVELCNGATTDEIREAIASQVQAVKVSDFVASMRTVDGEHLVPAERQAWGAEPGLQGHVAVLAIAARRAREIDGTAAQVYLGYDNAEWGPGWLSNQFAAGGSYTLRAWLGNLVEMMLARSQAVSLDKFRLTDDGRAVVPAQVRERDGSWRKASEAGRVPLSLRLLPLADILAGAGILDRHDKTWSVNEIGKALVELA